MALRSLTRLLGRSLHRAHARSPADPLQLLAAWPEQHLSSTGTTVLGSTVGAAGNSTAAASGASSTTPSFQANYGVAARQLQNDLETYRVSVVTGNLRGAAASAWHLASSSSSSSSSSLASTTQQPCTLACTVLAVLPCGNICTVIHQPPQTNPQQQQRAQLARRTLAPYPCID
jgi:hypothetical protein